MSIIEVREEKPTFVIVEKSLKYLKQRFFINQIMFNWLLIIIEFISRTFQKDQVSRQTKHTVNIKAKSVKHSADPQNIYKRIDAF